MPVNFRLYDYSKYELNKVGFEKKWAYFRQKFDGRLSQLLERMTDVNASQRPRPLDLLAEVRQIRLNQASRSRSPKRTGRSKSPPKREPSQHGSGSRAPAFNVTPPRKSDLVATRSSQRQPKPHNTASHSQSFSKPLLLHHYTSEKNQLRISGQDAPFSNTTASTGHRRVVASNQQPDEYVYTSKFNAQSFMDSQPRKIPAVSFLLDRSEALQPNHAPNKSMHVAWSDQKFLEPRPIPSEFSDPREDAAQ